MQRRKVRDSALLDALEASPRIASQYTLWRVVRADRDPLRPSAAGGRWDDGTFDVLYTSMESDGAIAEVYFHLMRGQPVFPSKMEFYLYELDVRIERGLHLLNVEDLVALGVDGTKYGSMEYTRRLEEYSRTQEIAEAAHFLDFDGLVIPNARWNCQNVVLFSDRIPPGALAVREKPARINWDIWKSKNKI